MHNPPRWSSARCEYEGLPPTAKSGIIIVNEERANLEELPPDLAAGFAPWKARLQRRSVPNRTGRKMVDQLI
jgi:hypothetical protein